MRAQIAPEALGALMRHDWPGNVRELANVLERAQILAEDHLITLDDLQDNLQAHHAGADTGGPHDLFQIQRRHVLAVLEESGGKRSTRPGPWASAGGRCTGCSRSSTCAATRARASWRVKRPDE